MDLVKRLSNSLLPKDNPILQEVKDYINRETNSGKYPFDPRNLDDIPFRTYLLDCRTGGIVEVNENNRILV